MNFCTHFDKNYIPYGLCLLDSLNKWASNFTLHIICMDIHTHEYLKNSNKPNIKLYLIEDLEKEINGLKAAKENRNKVEYFFTCSPAVCKYVLLKNPKISSITYLDSDLYFFSSPSILFDEIGDHSIAIIEHRFHWITKRQIKYGKFNVGWVTFKNDIEGNKCLDDWLRDCLDWCYQKVEEERFGDQKYLDKWPSMYKNLKIVQNIGANVAIWNVKNYRWSLKNNRVYVNNTPLVFYHFANIYQIDNYQFNTNLSRVFMPLQGVIKENVYKVFLKHIVEYLTNTSIKYKSDNHIIGFKKMIFKTSRMLRAFIFNDIIEIRE